MAVTQALHLTNGSGTGTGATAAEYRAAFERWFTRGRSGVIRSASTPDDSLLVSERAGTPVMGVDVADGACAVLGTEASAQGVYLVDAPTLTEVTIQAADPTNDRFDAIVVRVKDQDYTSGSPSTNTTTIEAIAGTPAGSPVLPTIPDNCLVLAEVEVQAAVTSIVDADITDRRWNGYSTHNDQDNGSILVGSSVGLSTSLPQTAAAGHRHWGTDTNSEQVWTGTAWEGPGVWKAYTPSHTNVTFSSETARYTRIGDTIMVTFLGTVATASGGNVSLGLPITPSGFYTSQVGVVGMAYLTDATASLRYSGVLELEAGASARVFRAGDGGIASGSAWNTTANVPITWAAGDLVHFHATYEA